MEFLPVYDLFEPLPGNMLRIIGEAQGIESAERACETLLGEEECETVQVWLGDRVVEEGTLNPDGKVKWTTYGRRKDLR
jgi:hypothetical protein